MEVIIGLTYCAAAVFLVHFSLNLRSASSLSFGFVFYKLVFYLGKLKSLCGF